MLMLCLVECIKRVYRSYWFHLLKIRHLCLMTCSLFCQSRSHIQSKNRGSQDLKVYSLILRSSFNAINKQISTTESQIQNFSLFRFCVSELCTITCIANAPLTAMLKILSDPIINQTIGSSDQINMSLQLCFRISCFLSVCHQINTK